MPPTPQIVVLEAAAGVNAVAAAAATGTVTSVNVYGVIVPLAFAGITEVVPTAVLSFVLELAAGLILVVFKSNGLSVKHSVALSYSAS